MTMITPSYLGETIEYSSLHACRSTLEDPTAAPYVSDAIQGLGCVDGAIFACATLALDVAGQTQLAGVAQDGVDLAGKTADCADGDLVACAQVGVKGASVTASAAGVSIPGTDAVSAGVQCANSQDFDGCVQLGQLAAGAAGLPVGAASQAATNVNGCINGDTGACIALGQQAAQAGVPVGGVAQGAASLQQCSQGDLVACTQLGQALVAAAP